MRKERERKREKNTNGRRGSEGGVRERVGEEGERERDGEGGRMREMGRGKEEWRERGRRIARK